MAHCRLPLISASKLKELPTLNKVTLPLPFTFIIGYFVLKFSIQREVWSFHVAYVERRGK